MATTTKTGETMTDTAKARLFALSVRPPRRRRLSGWAKAKAARTVRESTAGTYARLAKSRLDVSSETGGRLMDGVSARSWHTTRAALLHEATRAFVAARRRATWPRRQATWRRRRQRRRTHGGR